jgi:hypothetical protein
MWGVAHLRDDSREDRNARRRRPLDGEFFGGAVAGDAGLAELSPRSVHAGKLLGVFVRRTASKPRSHNGRRFAVYVPEDLAGEVRRGAEDGRALQDLLVQAGPRYVKALKRARASAAKNKKS